MQYKIAEPPEEWQGEIPPAPQGRSWFQGGRPLNAGATSQGGGAPIGGGVGGDSVLGGGESTSWLPNHRGFIGGWGVRTGGYG